MERKTPPSTKYRQSYTAAAAEAYIYCCVCVCVLYCRLSDSLIDTLEMCSCNFVCRLFRGRLWKYSAHSAPRLPGGNWQKVENGRDGGRKVHIILPYIHIHLCRCRHQGLQRKEGEGDPSEYNRFACVCVCVYTKTQSQNALANQRDDEWNRRGFQHIASSSSSSHRPPVYVKQKPRRLCKVAIVCCV